MQNIRVEIILLWSNFVTSFNLCLYYVIRLETTLFSMRNWQASRANATLHNWHVKEFLLITQCDLLNASDDCFGLLQVKISR